MNNVENENRLPDSTAESTSQAAQTGYRTAFGVALIAGIFSICRERSADRQLCANRGHAATEFVLLATVDYTIA